MMVSHKNLTALTMVLALATVALLPLWPYSRWGYTPAALLGVIVVLMLMYQKMVRA